LGDFFHTRESQSENVLATLLEWRGRHSDLQIELVLGNHDAHAGAPPDQLDIHAIDAPHIVAPFVCCHLPQADASEEGYLLTGHLHPFVTMREQDGSSLRFPAFIFGPDQAILPAFGGFTGGSAYKPRANDRVVVMAQGEIVEIARPGRVCVESPRHRK